MSNSNDPAKNGLPEADTDDGLVTRTKANIEGRLVIDGVVGELRRENNTAAVTFSLHMAEDGKLTLSFSPLSITGETRWLFDVLYNSGSTLPWLRVQGVTPEGITIESDYFVELRSEHHNDAITGLTLTLGGEAYQAQVRYQPPPLNARGVTVTYFTVGLTVAGVPAIDTPQGRVTVHGPMKLDNHNDLDGFLVIDAPEADQPLADWLTEVDQLADRILDIFSLAEGRLVRWSVRRLDYAGKLVVLDCEGDKHTSSPWDPVFTAGNLQPLLELAVSHYTQDLRERTGFDVSVEWFVYRSRYTELQLIAAMNAVEHLLTSFDRTKVAKINSDSTLIDPMHFNLLLTHMLADWDRFSAASPTEKEGFRVLKEKIVAANRRGSKDKLESRLKVMLQTYKVPLDGLAWSRVQAALAARHSVVHEGLYQFKGNEPLREHVTVVRELLKRVFLTLLSYKGHYETLLDGRDYVPFPPCIV